MSEIQLERDLYEVLYEITNFAIDDMTTSDIQGLIQAKTLEVITLFKEYEKYKN